MRLRCVCVPVILHFDIAQPMETHQSRLELIFNICTLHDDIGEGNVDVQIEPTLRYRKL